MTTYCRIGKHSRCFLHSSLPFCDCDCHHTLSERLYHSEPWLLVLALVLLLAWVLL